jgi:ribonuclease J
VATSNELVFLPLGGAGEIGMNLNLYGYGPPDEHQWIMVDLGVTFGDETTPGVDVIMADPEFIAERREQLLALVLTHAHEDHIGAVPYLWEELQCPIYATPFTAALVRGKLDDAGLNEVDVNIVELGGHIQLGPFAIELVTLTHSIPEPNALAIRTDLGTVLHTGDWKIDPEPLVGEATDSDRLKQIGDEGVLAIVCDSTNVFNPGVAGSESDVRKSLHEQVAKLTGRVAITGFASNVARLSTVGDVAKATDRHLVLVGRSMKKIVSAARDSGYLADFPATIDEAEAGYLPPDNVLYLCTGSQGEPRAALARIASGNHPNVTLSEGDTVIFSSRVIPGNEKSIFAMQNQLVENGVKVVTEKDHFVHVSGHPCRDELVQMYQWVKPKIAIPVHGEMRHLIEHAALARELQVNDALVAPNGSLVRIAPDEPEIVAYTHSGRLHMDGDVLLPADDESLRERRRLAFAGHIAVSIVIGKKGALLARPRIVLLGVPSEDEEELVADLCDVATEVLAREKFVRGKDTSFLEELVRRSVRKAARIATGKKPLTQAHIFRVDE